MNGRLDIRPSINTDLGQKASRIACLKEENAPKTSDSSDFMECFAGVKHVLQGLYRRDHVKKTFTEGGLADLAHENGEVPSLGSETG